MTRSTLTSDLPTRKFVRRGERVIKRKGRTASIVPQTGEQRASASTVAIGAVMMFGAGWAEMSPVMAGACVNTASDWGTFICSGPAGFDGLQALLGTSINVITEAGFGLDVAAGDALTISGSDGTSFTDTEGSIITGQNRGIGIYNSGNGALLLTSTGTVSGTNFEGIFALNIGNSTDLTIDAADSDGFLSAISARNEGSGALSVTSTGTATGDTGDGIFAQNSAAGNALTVTAANTIGGLNGINTRSYGNEGLSISVTGDVSGQAGNGLDAYNSANGMIIDQAEGTTTTGSAHGIVADNNGGSLTINAQGTTVGTAAEGIEAINRAGTTDLTISSNIATGFDDGIRAENFGNGVLSVTSTGTARGTEGDGVFAQNSVNGGALSVVTTDSIGGQNGILASGAGDGALTIISIGTATGFAGYGISAASSASSTALAITAADTVGGASGIRADNFGGRGAVTINSSGTATGIASVGIFARNLNGTSLTITAADSNGGYNGIRAANYGSGALSVTSTGAATGDTGNGIFVQNSAAGMSLSVTASDTIGGLNGIGADNFGSEGLSISVTGDVTGQAGNGIDAFNSANDMIIDQAEGTMTTGEIDGIFANNNGGFLTINALGTTMGETDDGIEAINAVGTTDLTINSNIATGFDDGIDARNFGSGDLTITSTGTATGTEGDGVFAQNSVNGGVLSVVTTDSIGGQNGISARNEGAGALSINSTGTATGTNRVGIHAVNSANGTDLTIMAADSNGGEFGIFTQNFGTDALTIISTGTATGTNWDGILADNLGTALTIMAANSNGGQRGILASNGGNDALTIISTGTATGTNGDGIFANNSAASTALTITAADTIGGLIGIRAYNNGTGELAIISSGTVTGTTGDGILARNSTAGMSLTIDAVDSNGGLNGIRALNNGIGILSINSTGTATGTTGDGILAVNSANGADLTIDAADTVGGLSGINALNDGAGVLSITSTGTATGTTGDGIIAFNSAAGTSLSVTAADTTGGLNGINARNYGTAGLSISVTGDVTGQAENGIDAFNSVNDITASMVIDQAEGTTTTGAMDGIFADNNGGSLTINALGTVIGETDDGIEAINAAGTTDLTITSNIASGFDDGIRAVNSGQGALSIISTGTATGTNDDAIFAVNSAAGTALMITAVNSYGGDDGISARNNGADALTITSTGMATGNTGRGIRAFNISGLGTALTVTAADTDGDLSGVYANNYGIGTLSINSTGTATGTTGDGILAVNSANGADLTIDAADTVGGLNGINALNDGAGVLSITSTGTATGTDGDGIIAFNSAAGTSLSVTAADTTGGLNGINARNEGVGALSINSTGTIAGETGNAITAITTGSVITVNNSGTLESGAGFALEASGGTTSLTNSGTINGRVQLSMFDDDVVNSGLFNATADSVFGAGNDLFINDGTLAAAGTITLVGLEQFVNNDLVTMIDGAVGGSLILPGDYVGSGTLAIDVSFDGLGQADTLVVAGSATGSTVLSIDDISTSPIFGNIVLIVDAGAGTAEDAFSLGETTTIGFYYYSLTFEAPDNDFFLTNTIGTPVFQTLKFVEGAQSLWYRSADAWAAHMASQRIESGSPFWIQIYGNVASQEDDFDFTSGGFTQNISINYDQDYFGFQTGFDFGPGVDDDGVLFGLTAGIINSNLGFDGTADNVRYDAFNIGAYAGVNSGRFFANALIKYDFVNADVRAQTAGYSANLDGEAYGARIEAGYRWGDDEFFLQPLASIEYQQASLDDLSALGANINFDKYDGLRGMAGVRLGGENEISGGNSLTYYVGGQAVHQSQTGDGLLFTSGASSIEAENRLSKTFGRFELGLNIATQNGVSGFIEGNADISGNYQSYGGRAGINIRF